MTSPKIKKKPTKSTTGMKEKKMQMIQKKKAERIKEKLSGKIDSPIVAKAKSAAKAMLKKKIPSQSPTPLVKKPLVESPQQVKLAIDKGKKKPLGGPNVKPKQVSSPKGEVKAETKAIKRKTEDAVNETSNKKIKVAPLVGVSLRKTESFSTSTNLTTAKKQKVKPVKQGNVSDKIIEKSTESSSVKTKKGKLSDKNEIDSTNKKSENINKKGALQIKQLKKNIGAKKVAGRTVEINKAEANTDDTSEPAKPVEVKSQSSVKRPKRKKSKSSISKLKPISNIKSLKKKPSPSTIKGRELRMKKLAAKYPERGVCYFSRIPHGFYEKELKQYCSQFGKVTGVYLPVSKKGNSKGYAFVEFAHKEVAQVVAETMNNYLMFYRLIKCKYLPPDEQKPWVFNRKLTLKKIADENREREKTLRNRCLSEEEEKKWQEQKTKRIKALHKKLEVMGVDYEFQVESGKEENQEVS